MAWSGMVCRPWVSASSQPGAPIEEREREEERGRERKRERERERERKRERERERERGREREMTPTLVGPSAVVTNSIVRIYFEVPFFFSFCCCLPFSRRQWT